MLRRKNVYTGKTRALKEGMRDGIPIGLGYLAVSFSLGIGRTYGATKPCCKFFM